VESGRPVHIIMTNRMTTGGDTDSYCTKCKLNLEHIIMAMIGGSIVKVKCKTCGSIHKFKGMPAAKPKTSRTTGSTPRSYISNQALWETAIDTAGGKEAPYDMSGNYQAGDIIVHNMFGKGVVQKCLYNKCTVLFRDRERILATGNS
jgi:hypothetical protein